jgi:hypothetical protein
LLSVFAALFGPWLVDPRQWPSKTWRCAINWPSCSARSADPGSRALDEAAIEGVQAMHREGIAPLKGPKLVVEITAMEEKPT